MDIEPEAAARAFDLRIPAAAALAGLAALTAVGVGAAHAADAADTAVDIAAGGFDLMDAAATLGAAIPISIAVNWWFRRSREAKQKETNQVAAEVLHTLRLGEALTAPGSTQKAVEELNALREIEKAAGGD